MKICFEDMQKIYSRKPMPKWDLLQIFIEIAPRHGCSPVNFLHIFRTPFPRNTSGWLLLNHKSRNNVRIETTKFIYQESKTTICQ